MYDTEATCNDLQTKNKQLKQEIERLRARNTVYRDELAKVLQVMDGFDYRTNTNLTMSECIGVEMEAKALLKEE